MWHPLRLACHAALVFACASCSSLTSPSFAHAAEIYSIQLDAGSPIATSLSDEGAMITHSLHGRYACHSLMGPKCLLTNGESDNVIPAAALGEMLRQVLASTVKARAHSPSDASASAASSSAASGSNSQQQSSSTPADDEAARARRASAAARPIASTSGVAYDDVGDDLDPGAATQGVAVTFEGGQVLYDTELEPHEIAELFRARDRAQAQAQGQGQGQGQGGAQPISERGAELLKKLLERAAAAASDKAAAAGNKAGTTAGTNNAAAPAQGDGKTDAAASSSSGGGLGGVRSLLSSIFDSSSYDTDDYADDEEEDGYEVEIDGRVHVLSVAEFRQFMAEHPWMELQHDEGELEQQDRSREQRRHGGGGGGRGQQRQP